MRKIIEAFCDAIASMFEPHEPTVLNLSLPASSFKQVSYSELEKQWPHRRL